MDQLAPVLVNCTSSVLFVDADCERVERILKDHGLDVTTRPSAPVFGTLSERDREVVSLVVDGLSNKEIGARLGIPETSVKRALQRVFDKCGVRTRGQVVRLAMESGFRG